MSLHLAVLGATGAVGQQMLRVLERRSFPVASLKALASPRSAGKELPFRGGTVKVEAVTPEAFEGVDVALFSAGGGTSREWAPIAASKGATVIDNSSAWRRDPEVPLVVPECNLDAGRTRPKGIIANPNCSTIQMVVALKPLHDAARVRRVVVATYQAISGSGAKAIEAFEAHPDHRSGRRRRIQHSDRRERFGRYPRKSDRSEIVSRPGGCHRDAGGGLSGC
jgi:aspartate-semialdehyde dehydrogenase